MHMEQGWPILEQDDNKRASTLNKGTSASTENGSIQLRPFCHTMEELNINFMQSNRPELVTSILAAMIEGKDKQAKHNLCWSWTLNYRMKLLLQLVFHDQPKELIAKITCQQDSCRETMELPFTEEELMTSIPDEAEQVVTLQWKNRDFKLKRPCGYHQQQWQQQSFDSKQAAMMNMIQSLSTEPIGAEHWDDLLSPEFRMYMDEQMETFDPMINFSVTSTCPYCGVEQSYYLDWEEIALKHLYEKQKQTVVTIHRLAAAYHWTEQDIMALPQWRKQYYLKLLGME